MGNLVSISDSSTLIGAHQPPTLHAPEIEAGVGCDFDSYLLVPDTALDFVALVVMAKNHDIAAKASLGGGDAVVEGSVRHEKVRVEVAAYASFDLRRVEGWRLVCADEGAAIRNGY